MPTKDSDRNAYNSEGYAPPPPSAPGAWAKPVTGRNINCTNREGDSALAGMSTLLTTQLTLQSTPARGESNPPSFYYGHYFW